MEQVSLCGLFRIPAVRSIPSLIFEGTMAELRFVYVTTGNREEALSIARAAVGERLAACANILGDMISVFRWEGAVQEDE